MYKWIRTTVLASLLVASASTLAATPAAPAATQELAGVWQGKLAVDPKTSLTIQFTFAKDAKGAYTAVLGGLPAATETRMSVPGASVLEPPSLTAISSGWS